MMRDFDRRAGMTLMELLVVISILGLLMGLLLPALSAARYSAHKARVRAEVKQLETAWKAYYDDYRSLPAVADMGANNGVKTLYGGNTNTRGFRYMEFDEDSINNGFKDKWGSLYQVALDAAGNGEVTADGQTVHRAVAVWSLGRDGLPATADDIKSWE